jgi:PTH1 family peptidyl-tRNA hydrolase
MLVVFDEVDLPLGTLRVRQSGGPGTHNGMRSIVNAVGQGFPRIRVGVAPERLREVPDLAEYVLSPFDADEKPLAEKAMDRAAEAAEVALRDVQRAMNQFNG